MHLDVALDYLLKILTVFTFSIGLAKSLELWDPFGWFSQPNSAAEVDAWLERRERALTLVATVASTAPFLGLAGTITHIIHALGSLNSANGDIGVISGPIALSLYSTLWGLASAIPAGIFYNLAVRRLQLMESHARRRFVVESKGDMQ